MEALDGPRSSTTKWMIKNVDIQEGKRGTMRMGEALYNILLSFHVRRRFMYVLYHMTAPLATWVAMLTQALFNR